MKLPENFIWEDRYLLGYGPMDTTHREFVSIVNALLSAPESELVPLLDAFAEHARQHFEDENAMMEKTCFPPRDCHCDEHQKVLDSLREVQAFLDAGNTRVVREFAAALRDWFPAHADYMDSALAKWIVHKSHGGSPVVFRRN